MNDTAIGISQHLDLRHGAAFSMSFSIYTSGFLKAIVCLAPSRLKSLRQRKIHRARNPQSSATSAGNRLDQNRKSDLAGQLLAPRLRIGSNHGPEIPELPESPIWMRYFPRAEALSPSWRMFSTVGPMNWMRQDWQISANCGFSDKNP